MGSMGRNEREVAIGFKDLFGWQAHADIRWCRLQGRGRRGMGQNVLWDCDGRPAFAPMIALHSVEAPDG